MKSGKHSVWCGLAAVAAAAILFVLWSVNYGIAIWHVSGHRYTDVLRQLFDGDILVALNQATTYWTTATVRKAAGLGAWYVVVELLMLGVAGALLVKQPWKSRPPAGGARLATLRDLKAAGMLDGEKGKTVLLGTYKGREVRYSGDSHFYVNGPSRSGKGRGFIMPNLLEWEGSAIVLDVKRENLEKTGAARLAMGQQVFELAPGSERSHRWNPLDFIRPWPSRSIDLQNMAATLIPVPDRGEAIWSQTARELFAGLLGYVTDSKTMEGRRSLRSVLRMFNEGDLAEVMSTIIESEPDLNSFITESFRRHIARDPRQRPSFEGNVTTALKAWNTKLIADMTSTSDFDIGQLRRRPFTVFISAPASDFGTVEPMIRLFIQQVHDVLLRHLPGRDEPHKVILMLDEFYQFQRLPEIINRAPLVAGYGFRIALVAQNMPQVDERYSRATREALLGNMDIKLVVAVGDKATGDVVAETIGKHYVERSSFSHGHSAGPFAQTSRQTRWEEVPLMTSDQLQRLDDNKTILTIRGHFSAVLDKMNFYTDKRSLDRLKAVARYEKRLHTPLLQAVPEWTLFREPQPSLRSRLESEGYIRPLWKKESGRSHGADVLVEGPETDEVMPQHAEVSPPIAQDRVETLPAEPLPRESAILQLVSMMGGTDHDVTESREGVLDRLDAMAEPDPQEM